PSPPPVHLDPCLLDPPPCPAVHPDVGINGRDFADVGRVARQVQAGAEADLQNVAAGVGEQFPAILGHERSVQPEVAEQRDDHLRVEAHRCLLPAGRMARKPHHPRRITANHAFGPPSLKLNSLKSGRTSAPVGSMDSMPQPSAKASCSSFLDTRLGPCVPGSSSLTHIRNSRPPGFSTAATPST